MFSLLLLQSPLQAEMKKIGHGVISVTFHEDTAHKNYSNRFYVTKEEGQTHWRNFTEQEESFQGPKRKGVYEVKSAQSFQYKYVSQSNNEVAQAKPNVPAH